MEPETGFHSEQHPGSRRWVVFEDDGTSAWLYLTAPDEMRPAADCWLYNRVPAPAPRVRQTRRESSHFRRRE